MVVTFKKMPTLYSVDIEADEICQIKKEEDILVSENKKQSLTDFRKFHRKISVLESLFVVKLLALNFFTRDSNTGVTSGGCFRKIYLDRPEKGGYTLLVKYLQTEVTSSVGKKCLQLYLKNFNAWLPLIFL